MKYEVRYTVVEIFTDRKLAEGHCYRAAEEQVARWKSIGKRIAGLLAPYGGPGGSSYGVCPNEWSNQNKNVWPRILVFEED